MFSVLLFFSTFINNPIKVFAFRKDFSQFLKEKISQAISDTQRLFPFGPFFRKYISQAYISNRFRFPCNMTTSI